MPGWGRVCFPTARPRWLCSRLGSHWPRPCLGLPDQQSQQRWEVGQRPLVHKQGPWSRVAGPDTPALSARTGFHGPVLFLSSQFWVEGRHVAGASVYTVEMGTHHPRAFIFLGNPAFSMCQHIAPACRSSPTPGPGSRAGTDGRTELGPEEPVGASAFLGNRART